MNNYTYKNCIDMLHFTYKGSRNYYIGRGTQYVNKKPILLSRGILNVILDNLIQVISWKCSGNKKCINAYNDLRAKCLQPGYSSSYDECVNVMSSFISIHCLEIHNVSYHMVLICNTISTQHISAFTCNLQGLKNRNCVPLLFVAIATIYVKSYWKKFA